MAAASFAQTSFIGGEVSKSVRGQFDHPGYRTWMNVCFNGMPMEQKSWTRRPGSMHLGTTRGGVPGRVISFDFERASPYTIEFTAGFMRFRAGPTLVTTNDDHTVVSISAANPAKVLTATHGWVNGNQVVFHGAGNPLLDNRQFTIIVTSATEFTLADAVTGASIDGATLGALAPGATVARVLEFATPYTGTLWHDLRRIQADIPIVGGGTKPGAIMLHGSIIPYVLQVVTAPTDTAFATFTFAPSNFKDGPYLDPVAGGTLATPSALNGIITLTLSYPAYDAARAYAIGDYVTSGGVNYKSLVDANLGSAPPSANWVATTGADAIGPNGFQGTDVGRLVRLYSEPALWAVATAYAKDAVVAYGGTGNRSEGAVYWISLAGGNTGNIPGADLTKWALYPNGAIWTWGKITGLSNIIDRALAGSVNFGDMTVGGGVAAAFDGILSQTAATGALSNSFSVAFFVGPTSVTHLSYVGKNYSGATDQIISQALVYPSSDQGLVYGSWRTAGVFSSFTVTLNLRGKASAPASAADGTLLATTGVISDTTAPITLISTDQTTAWKYVWIEQISTMSMIAGQFSSGFDLNNAIGEVSFFNPTGTGTAQGVTVQILGDALLYTTAIRTWRLGLYSNTTGWPRCGTYHEGRLWLSGVVANRIDSSRSNEPFNFAPTNPDGTVPGNAGISYIFNAPDVNPIFWLEPDDNGIICGTQAGEWLVRATQNNVPLTPTTTQAHRVTKYNCANILPAHTNLTTMVVQAFKRELLEYFPDVYSGKFSARDMAENSKHLVASGIEEVGYQQELIPIVWARCANGSLVGWTYGRATLVSSNPPDAMGAHSHALGSGRRVESICIGANFDGTLDALVMVTNDESGIRHVEMLANIFLETDDLADAWLLDNGIEPSSTATTSAASPGAPYGGLTINGLWNLNDKTVQVFVAGLDCGQGEAGTAIVDFVVSNGAVFVPYGDGISAGTGGGLFTSTFAADAVEARQIVVGFTYNSDGQIVRPNSPQESGARNGPAFGKLRRSHQYGVLVEKAASLSVGVDFDHLDPAKFNQPGSGSPLGPAQTYSGVFRDVLGGDDSFDGAVCWRASRPFPMLIAAIGEFPHTKDI